MSLFGTIHMNRHKVKLQNICASSSSYYNVLLTFHAIRMESSQLKGLNHCGAPTKVLKHLFHQIGEK